MAEKLDFDGEPVLDPQGCPAFVLRYEGPHKHCFLSIETNGHCQIETGDDVADLSVVMSETFDTVKGMFDGLAKHINGIEPRPPVVLPPNPTVTDALRFALDYEWGFPGKFGEGINGFRVGAMDHDAITRIAPIRIDLAGVDGVTFYFKTEEAPPT